MESGNGVGLLEPREVGHFDTEHPWPGLPVETPLYEITLSIAYTPETGEVKLDGSFRGGADGHMLLELAAERIREAFPKP